MRRPLRTSNRLQKSNPGAAKRPASRPVGPGFLCSPLQAARLGSQDTCRAPKPPPPHTRRPPSPAPACARPAGVFSAGVPAHFHANFQAALCFVEALEGYCTQQAQVCGCVCVSGRVGPAPAHARAWALRLPLVRRLPRAVPPRALCCNACRPLPSRRAGRGVPRQRRLRGLHEALEPAGLLLPALPGGGSCLRFQQVSCSFNIPWVLPQMHRRGQRGVPRWHQDRDNSIDVMLAAGTSSLRAGNSPSTDMYASLLLLTPAMACRTLQAGWRGSCLPRRCSRPRPAQLTAPASAGPPLPHSGQACSAAPAPTSSCRS